MKVKKQKPVIKSAVKSAVNLSAWQTTVRIQKGLWQAYDKIRRACREMEQALDALGEFNAEMAKQLEPLLGPFLKTQVRQKVGDFIVSKTRPRQYATIIDATEHKRNRVKNRR